MNQTPATPPICWNLVISAHHAHSAKYLCAEHKHVVPELPSVYMVIEEVAEVASSCGRAGHLDVPPFSRFGDRRDARDTQPVVIVTVISGCLR